MPRFWLPLGFLLLGLGIVCGAVGAHVVRPAQDAQSFHAFQSAVLYQLIAAFGIVSVVITTQLRLTSPKLSLAALCLLLAGVVLFSGSIYARTLWQLPIPGMLTPLGGLCLIFAWFVLAVAAALPSRT